MAIFCINVNDIVNRIGKDNINLYADDTVIYIKGNNCKILNDNLQNMINIFSKWCNENKLSVNAEKTKLVCFGTQYRIKNFLDLKINLMNDCIKRVTSYKYLGVILLA